MSTTKRRGLAGRVFEGLHTRQGAAIALALLVSLHVILNVVWLVFDEHVIRIDEEFHSWAAQAFFYAITNPSLESWGERFSELVKVESPYPPLLHLVGAALALLFGYSSDTVALSGTLCLALIIIGSYLVARQMLSRPRALFCALVTSLTPILYAGSRYVALENLVAALVIWGLYLLLRSQRFTRRDCALAFGIVNGLLLLTKPNGFVYYLAPAALVFAMGLYRAFRDRSVPEATGILLNGVVCVTVTLVIALPWYTYHLEELERYWMTEHKSGQTPFTFSRATESYSGLPRTFGDSVQYAGAPRVEAWHTTEVTAIAEPPITEREQRSASWKFESRRVFDREWLAYPLMVVNNGTYLPLGLLGLAGFVCGAWRFRRYRQFWVIVAWLLGSYLLNTLLFRYINPRYTLPFIAAFALGATYLLAVLPGRRSRMVYGAVLVAFLGAQYLNVSFLHLQRFDAWLPVLQDAFRVRYFGDEGLTVTKAQIITGTYSFRAPVPGENYVQRAFRAMQTHEIQQGNAPGRPVAYATLSRQNNYGGFRFMERTYWPQPNPLIQGAFRGRPELQYIFYRLVRSNEPEEVVANLENLDYVVVTLDQTEATLSDGPYHKYFATLLNAAPLDLVDFYLAPSYGLLPPAIVGVLAKRQVTDVRVTGNIFQLYDGRDMNRMDEEVARALRGSYTEFFEAAGQHTPINEDIAFSLLGVRRISDRLIHVRAVFECLAPVELPHKFIFEMLPMDGESMIRSAEPYTKLTDWQPGLYYFVNRYFQVGPGDYELRLHIMDGPESTMGRTIDMGRLTI